MGMNPHSGLTGRLLHTTLALTFTTNLIGHIALAVSNAGWASGSTPSMPSPTSRSPARPCRRGQRWAGYDASGHPRFRQADPGLRLPGADLGNLLLTIQFAPVGTTWPPYPGRAHRTTYYSSRLGVALELSLGRKAT